MQRARISKFQLLLLFLLPWLIVICASNEEVIAKKVQKRGVMDGFNEGLKYAGQMFGINTAADVANLVARAFSGTSTSRKRPDFMSIFQTQKYSEDASNGSESQEQTEPQEEASRQDEQETQHSLFTKTAPTKPTKEAAGLDFTTTKFLTSMLRMIGFDASKLGALAINALIMIAQAIGSTLMKATKGKVGLGAVDGGGPFGLNKQSTGPDALYANEENAHQPRALHDDTPLDWFLNDPKAHNKQFKSLLGQAKDSSLPDQLLQMIEQVEAEGGEGGCLKLLICKSTPFIWGMQKSLLKSYNSNATLPEEEEIAMQDEEPETGGLNAQMLFKYLPSLNEYRKHGAECEARFADYCNRTEFYKPENSGN